MSNNEAYEHYRRLREDAAAKLVDLVDNAHAETRTYLARPSRVVDEATIAIAIDEYRYAEGMMSLYAPKQPSRRRKKPASDHVWRKEQILGRGARNKGR